MILSSRYLPLNTLCFLPAQATTTDLQRQQRAHVLIRPLRMSLNGHHTDIFESASCFWTEEAMILESVSASEGGDSAGEFLYPFAMVLDDVLLVLHQYTCLTS